MVGRRSRMSGVVSRIYDEVQIALWAGLAGFVIFFCAFIMPDLPAAVQKAENTRVLEVADENRNYCVKWGKAEGTQEHAACLINLQELRSKMDRRRADAMLF